MRQKIADLINVIFGFRKFIAWLALFLVAVLFRYLAYIDGGQFVDLMKSTFLAFVAGNGVEHMVSVAKEYVKGQATATVTTTADDDLVEGDGK